MLVIKAVVKAILEERKEQRREDCAFKDTFIEGVEMSCHPVDARPGRAVSEKCHEPLEKVWGTPSFNIFCSTLVRDT